MSPELETRDQLLGGEMALSVVRNLYTDDQHFARSVHALLLSGDVRLLAHDGAEVPRWRWHEMFVEGGFVPGLPQLRLAITDQGARRIG